MSEKRLIIGGNDLTFEDLRFFLEEKPQVELNGEAQNRVRQSRRIIEDIVNENRVVYGVTTGFGKFADVRIKPEQTRELQRRLVLSHAAGTGKPMSEDIVRLMMLLKIKNLSQGHSGVRLRVVNQLAQMLNRGVTPVVPEKGSVGASGDLAPLAHMALVMIGEGEAFFNGERMSGAKALEKAGLQPIPLEAKEGLALLNGTQSIQAWGVIALLRAKRLVKVADIVGAVSLEGLLGTLTAFDERIQKVRRHPGQLKTAKNFLKILSDSPIVKWHRESSHRVQDAYSLRCIPQVHGAIRDGVEYVAAVFEREINGVTDNPLVFPENGDVLSGGNFHGEPVAMAADYLGILISELANISERRIEHMMDPAVSEMAGFLTEEGGLNSGFMIAQVTAAALVSENKVLAHPASVDSIPTSANKEDHVSMGMHAARKALEIVENAETVLGIELMCACQGLDLRKPLKPSEATGAVLDEFRKEIPRWTEDRVMYPDIEIAKKFVCSKKIIEIVEQAVGKLE
ncbi:MAG: histidine ammonia-lyase [Calditrichaeota bacterium]|nr:histidine ammonia-lyase [Calditrichota bacterium]